MRKPVYAICCLDRIIPLVSISEISSLYLVSVTAQTGLSLPWSQTPKTGFLVTWLICYERRLAKGKIYRREMTFYQLTGKINSHKNT